jgi:tetratricopeptide (TPR) repeat protein
MSDAPPNLKSSLAHAAIEALLVAHKSGTLEEMVDSRPRAVRRLARPWLRIVGGTAGDALARGHALALALRWLARWAVTQLRPDHGEGIDQISRTAWLDQTSWRPMLALMCHYGFAPPPVFRDRYHARTGEAAADVLCGLWSIGPSTFYRYLDKAERQLQQLLAAAPTAAASMSLRRAVTREAYDLLQLEDTSSQQAWHREQAAAAAERADAVAALWHLLCATDARGFAQQLRRSHVELAAAAETDALCEAMARAAPDLRSRFDLHLALASVWRTRDAPERERQCYEQALRLATQADDAVLLGTVCGALGKFHEPRDADRAFAYYEDSAEYLRRATSTPGAERDADVMQEYASTLVRLAWLYVLRNDPRARAMLERAQQLLAEHRLHGEVAAMLEQTWGEFQRRAGDLRRALEHKHRALNIYERLGDMRSVLVTYLNMIGIYGALKDFDRAIDYGERVLKMAEKLSIEPEMLSSTHNNLGAIYFWLGRIGDSIAAYTRALDISEAAKLPQHTRRAHYNLAEAHYKRFQITRDADDERLGDAHAAAALALAAGEGDPARVEATRGLKSEVLGSASGGTNPDRLLPQEFATHFEEMTDVQRQRAVLAIPIEPQAHVRAHLAIARAYLAISAKEREAALALIHKHGLGEQFGAEFDDLRSTFNRELTREQQLSAQWQQAAADLLRDDRRTAVLSHLFQSGSINKSTYAQVCDVALATASKHLVTLAERGLLLQTGKGPSTRYLLPPPGGEAAH